MSNCNNVTATAWKRWDENTWYNQSNGHFLQLGNFGSEFHVTIASHMSVHQYNRCILERDFPTEQAAREFIEEFIGVSANGKLSDSKSGNQGSSPCAPELFITDEALRALAEECQEAQPDEIFDGNLSQAEVYELGFMEGYRYKK